MRALTIPVLSLWSAFSAVAQNVGIGTPDPHPSAILHVEAADKGILMPRLTMAQMAAKLSEIVNT